MEKSRLKQIIKFISQTTNQLLWPAMCINCGENISETDNSLCKNCWSDILVCTNNDYCHRCGCDASKYAIVNGACPNCQGKEFHFDRIARTGLYSASLQKIILGFKFKGKTELSSVLGMLANSALEGSEFYNDIDLFVPVPLHWVKRFLRGYNQSFIISKSLKHPSAKINTGLVRIRYTKAQPTMTNTASRIRNVAGAFAVRLGHKFTGKNICLIDDIKTTGATLNECAKTLKETDAAKVYALVLAVAGQNTKVSRTL